MADDRTDEPEGNDGHDDERLGIGAQGNRQQRVDQEERNGMASGQCFDALLQLSWFTLKSIGEARMVREREWQYAFSI